MPVITETKTTTRVLDSLDGKLLSATTKPLMLAINDDIYALYFSEANLAKFQTSMKRYIKNEAPMPVTSPVSDSDALSALPGTSGGVEAAKPAESHTERPMRIRDWANANGYTVSAKGRIARDVLLAFANATV